MQSSGFLIHWSGVRIPSGAQLFSIFAGGFSDNARPHRPSIRSESGLAGTRAVQTSAEPTGGYPNGETRRGRRTGEPAERHPGKARTLGYAPKRHGAQRDAATFTQTPGRPAASTLTAPGGAHSSSAWALALAAEQLGLGVAS